MKPQFMWLPKYFIHGSIQICCNIYDEFILHLKFKTKIEKTQQEWIHLMQLICRMDIECRWVNSQKIARWNPRYWIWEIPLWLFQNTPIFPEPLPHTKSLVALFLLAFLELWIKLRHPTRVIWRESWAIVSC